MTEAKKQVKYRIKRGCKFFDGTRTYNAGDILLWDGPQSASMELASAPLEPEKPAPGKVKPKRKAVPVDPPPKTPEAGEG